MDDILRGNFKVKKPITLSQAKKKESVKDMLKKKALASLGGSMVYVERDRLIWDGDSQIVSGNE